MSSTDSNSNPGLPPQPERRRWLPPSLSLLFLVKLLAVVAAAAMAYGALRQTNDASAASSHALEVQRAVLNVNANLIDAETGQRGYLLTGRPEYKEPYTHAAAQVQAQLTHLAQIYSRWPDRTADVRKLDELTRQRMSELDTTVSMFDTKRTEGWRDLVLTDIGRETMVAIEG